MFPIILGGKGGLRPIAQADFRYNVLPSAVTFTRASAGTYFTSTGNLAEATTNIPRFTHDVVTGQPLGLLLEPSRTNFVANPRFEGGTPGVIGSGGVLPSTMGMNSPPGLTRTFLGTGVEDGIPYLDMRWDGTTTGGLGTFNFVVGPWVCSVGQTFALRFVARLIGGMLVNVFNLRMRVQERQGSTQLANFPKVVFTPTAAPLIAQQRVDTHTVTNSNTDNALLQFAFDITPNQPVDITLRLGLPQVEAGSVTTTPIFPPAGSPAVSTRAAETAVMQVPGPDRNVRLLVQDVGGAEWRTVAVSGGVIPLAPRTGQMTIRRARVWEVGALTSAQEAALAVPA